jgi:hypothetical protein
MLADEDEDEDDGESERDAGDSVLEADGDVGWLE